jgi:hypothetical protein
VIMPEVHVATLVSGEGRVPRSSLSSVTPRQSVRSTVRQKGKRSIVNDASQIAAREQTFRATCLRVFAKP